MGEILTLLGLVVLVWIPIYMFTIIHRKFICKHKNRYVPYSYFPYYEKCKLCGEKIKRYSIMKLI